MRLRSTLLVLAIGALCASALAAWPRAARARAALPAAQPASPALIENARAPRFGRDIRPLLSDRCFQCHGPDAAKRQAKLRLDEASEATRDRGGHAALVPGSLDKSELWARVTSADPEERMPPADSHKPALSADELALVRRWIEAGAPYEPHWAFVPPARPALPELESSWPRDPLDRFVLAEQQRAGIEPSPPADAASWLRRVFLDLTGLPPTPAELADFRADSSEAARARWVERLLHEEPYVSRYAERMATPWLDGARYADTNGIHMDAGRQMWAYRDWVLAAFRDGMPFDRFVTEQLAGDLLPNATQAQQVATGYQRCHVITDEGGAIDEEYRVEYAVDRVNTTGSMLLGLTVGCARCHDHKFDPITMDDYYALFAYYDSIDEPGLYSQLPDPNRAFEPSMQVPSEEQRAKLGELERDLAAAQSSIEAPAPEDDALRARYLAELGPRLGLAWAALEPRAASSSGGASFALQTDGSWLASGANPAQDEQRFTLRTDAQGLRLLLVEALTDASLGNGRVGRGENGNAVLSSVAARVRSLADPTRVETIALRWAWADHEQDNGDFAAANLLRAQGEGWAVDGHRRAGGRRLLLLSEQPFGFAGGSELELVLGYHSRYAQHVLGRLRFAAAALAEPALEFLPTTTSYWQLAGPFAAENGQQAFERAFGPELAAAFDASARFGGEDKAWRSEPERRDARVEPLAEGINASYVGKRLFAPSARTLEVSLGSDDGLRVFLNGAEVLARQVDRAAAADQDKAQLALRAGENWLVLKIVNTGGQAGFYYRALARAEELAGELAFALLPERARDAELEQRFAVAWRRANSPSYRALAERIASLESELEAQKKAVPLTMVLRERAERRATHVLKRGRYDAPDESRTIARGVPKALGQLPAGAPDDRRGLAQWLFAPENPLVARVAVNRLWELVFGSGLVRTSEDFGLQGEWPTHPELLDYLALEYRASGWDTKAMLQRLVLSATYAQSSRRSERAAAVDPENRLLGWFPRKRLSAEQIRDQALYVAGLLVEKFGGPSVKPYQPEGLWQEVAMLQSNTRVYERGMGDALWRRSLYTYWKRACPPPALMTFDAPTRESCTIRRSSTNTPLQALALWNDEQQVEAARALASRLLAAPADDAARLDALYGTCASRAPLPEERAALADALRDFRARYAADREAAEKLVEIGESPVAPGPERAELAAWTLLASAVLSSDAVICRN